MSVDILPSNLTEALTRALRGLEFGSIELVVHDGHVVHVERRERVRLLRADDRSPDRRQRIRDPGDRPHRAAGGAVSMDDEETNA